MKPLEKLAVLLLLTFAFCGCTRTSEVKTDEKLAVQEEVHEKGRERTSETVQVGPETITTTVEEFALEQRPPSVAPPLDPSVSGAGTTSKARFRGSDSSEAIVPSPPLLVKRTVTVDQRGPVLDTKTASTQTAVDTSLAEKQEKASDTKKKTSFALPWWLWALGAVGVALGIAIVRKTLLGKAVAAAETAAKEVL